MDPAPETLVVRQHERVRCALVAHLSPSPEIAEQVRLARGVGDGDGIVRAEVIDCSPGGIGIASTTYFPKASALRVRVTSDPADGSVPELLFEGLVRVQRATMTGCEPTYYLGASFAERLGADGVSRLMEAARASAPVGAAEGARA